MSVTFISAGAGSGKTHRLMALIAESLEAGVEPERIIATSFTKKAAAEIRERLQNEYIRRGDFAGAAAAGAVTVGTVNSVAGRLLSLFAFDSGLSPELSVLDEEEAQALLERVLERAVPEERIEELGRLERRFNLTPREDGGWHKRVAEIVNAARSSAIEAAELPGMAKRNADDFLTLLGPPLEDNDNALRSALEAGIPALQGAEQAKNIQVRAGYLELCKETLKNLERDQASWDSWLKLEDPAASVLKVPLAAPIASAAASWPSHRRLHGDVRRYLELLFTAAAEVMTAYDEAKNQGGLLDFTDQEAKLYALLENRAAAESLRERIGVLLVDEFQDTSPIQLALFSRLSLLAEKTYWVGDVKQAIYGFRGSDAALMEGILEALEKGGSTPEILPYSWRSRPSLVRLCNDIFVPAFSAELPPERVALEPKREELPGEAFMHWILEGSNVKIRAAQLARGIHDLVGSAHIVLDRSAKTPRAIQWGDIAVLARSNDDVAALSGALKSAGIPLKASGSGLLSTPEASLALACLRRLNDAGDSLASAEILGLTEGLTAEQWLPERLQFLKTAEGREKNLWRCAGPEANPVLRALEELRPLAADLAPLDLFDILSARCGLDGLALAWSREANRGRERLSNLEGLRTLIRDFEEDSRRTSKTLSSLLLHLEDLRGNDPLPESPAEGVSVLTWHGAKGLEWPAVILHGTGKKFHDVVWNQVRTLRDGALNIDRPLEGSWIRLWPKPFGSLKKFNINFSQDPHVAALEARSEREERRLLYVGATRARDLLIVAREGTASTPGTVASALGPTQDLFTEPRPGTTDLPLSGGGTIPYGCLSPVPMNAPEEEDREERLTWYDTEYREKERKPARITPSGEAGDGTKPEEKLPYRSGAVHGGAVPLPAAPEADPQDLGIRYHGAFAFYAQNPEAPATTDFPEELRRCVLSQLALMGRLWPQGRFHTELPLRSFLGSDNPGQYVDARLDLLVETDEGWHVVDHKLHAKKEASPDDTARKHGVQLEYYRRAVEAKTGRPVLGVWVALPQEGTLVEVLTASPREPGLRK